ncbi:hypothetical protein [Mumia sp. DW29H23]|uniref:hypothetical protein n=1 Tax=Mumia sp. DW29H23 TaxID=3421241 RepID=UPI003D680458
MTTLAHLRRTALSLPEAEEQADTGLVSFTVGGTEFVSVTQEGDVRLRLTGADVEIALAEQPGATPLPQGASPIGVQVPLAGLNGQQLNHWVRLAWLACAPERLSAPARAAETARAGEVGDLPRAIGNPATRALVAAGLASLADVRAYGVDRLGALHGVGPKAVAILEREVAALP